MADPEQCVSAPPWEAERSDGLGCLKDPDRRPRWVHYGQAEAVAHSESERVMGELRRDPNTHEWVLLATRRAKRPHDLQRAEMTTTSMPRGSSCPFWSGNEHLTPPEAPPEADGGRRRSRIPSKEVRGLQGGIARRQGL